MIIYLPKEFYPPTSSRIKCRSRKAAASSEVSYSTLVTTDLSASGAIVSFTDCHLDRPSIPPNTKPGSLITQEPPFQSRSRSMGDHGRAPIAKHEFCPNPKWFSARNEYCHAYERIRV